MTVIFPLPRRTAPQLPASSLLWVGSWHPCLFTSQRDTLSPSSRAAWAREGPSQLSLTPCRNCWWVARGRGGRSGHVRVLLTSAPRRCWALLPSSPLSHSRLLVFIIPLHGGADRGIQKLWHLLVSSASQLFPFPYSCARPQMAAVNQFPLISPRSDGNRGGGGSWFPQSHRTLVWSTSARGLPLGSPTPAL